MGYILFIRGLMGKAPKNGRFVHFVFLCSNNFSVFLFLDPVESKFLVEDATMTSAFLHFCIFIPRLGRAYCFRRVRSQRKSSCSQRKSLDWGTMGPALGGAYECYAHISRSRPFSTKKQISNTRERGSTRRTAARERARVYRPRHSPHKFSINSNIDELREAAARE